MSGAGLELMLEINKAMMPKVFSSQVLGVLILKIEDQDKY